MGFLDNLLSKGAKKLLDNVVDNATDRISDALDSKFGTTGSSTASNTKASKAPVAVRVQNILESQYPEYTIKKDVHPSTIGGTGTFRPYTYGLYLNDVPKAFIMVTEHNKDTHRDFRWSREEAQKNNIPFINFLTQFPNTDEYIKNRLAQFIK